MSVLAVSTAAANIALAGLAIPQGLGAPAANHLMAISSLQKKAAGETLFVEGDEADSVYEVVRGMLRLYKLLPDGRRQIMGFLSAGHLLGVAPEGVCIYTAEAVTDVTLCRYKRAAFERLIDDVPGFARRVLTAASHELCSAQDQMLLLGRKSATERVASFLLVMAGRGGGAACREIEVPMTRTDIADYLGLTIETVCRILTRLRQDGVIALPAPGRIEICDLDRLEELSVDESEIDA